MMRLNLKGGRRTMRGEEDAAEAGLGIAEDVDAVEEGAVAEGEGSDLKIIGRELPIERVVVALLYSLVHCLSFSSCLLAAFILSSNRYSYKYSRRRKRLNVDSNTTYADYG
jgi:hypothetical protein